MVASLITSLSIGIVLFLLRNWIITRLKESISHEYNQRLETIKSELRKSETEVDSLRTSLLSGTIHRGKLIYEKRIHATQVIWECTHRIAPLRQVAKFMRRINYENAAYLAQTQKDIRDFVRAFGINKNITEIGYNEAKKVQLFLSNLAWAYYESYHALACHAVLQQIIIEEALPPNLLDDKSVKTLLIAIYPDKKVFIEGSKIAELYDLMDDIEQKLFTELKALLKGKENDEEDIAHAREIINASQQLAEDSISNINFHARKTH